VQVPGRSRDRLQQDRPQQRNRITLRKEEQTTISDEIFNRIKEHGKENKINE